MYSFYNHPSSMIPASDGVMEGCCVVSAVEWSVAQGDCP